MFKILTAAVLTAGFLSGAAPIVRASSPTAKPDQAASARLTPADAAPFLGDWLLSLDGANGPMAFTLGMKVEKDAVVANLSSDIQPNQTITDISRSDKSIVLAYTFDYQGTPVPVVVTLTPTAEKLAANFDFAGGAYVMGGSGTKVEKAR